MREAYVRALAEEGLKNKNIFGIVADIGTFTFDDFREACPDRFINVGIAEANMIGIAAGLALEGKIPFVYAITPFVTARVFEPIRVDVCYQKLNVKIVGCGSGFSYSTLGATHHGTDDIAIMRVLPEMIVLSPADPRETKEVVEAAVKHKGPAYIRIGRSGEPTFTPDNYDFQIGKAVTLRDGKDLSIIGTGSLLYNALTAAEELRKDGLECRVINMHTIKPIDKEAVFKAAQETAGIITLEEHSIVGGLGTVVAEVLAEGRVAIPFKRMGLKDCFCTEYGKHEDLAKFCRLTPYDIQNNAKKLY